MSAKDIPLPKGEVFRGYTPRLKVSGPSKPHGPEGSIDFAILDQDGKIVGEAFGIVGPQEIRPARANATLWAAAPGMYEILCKLSDWFTKQAERCEAGAERVKDKFPGLHEAQKADAANYRKIAKDINDKIAAVKALAPR